MEDNKKRRLEMRKGNYRGEKARILKRGKKKRAEKEEDENR